MRFKVSRRVVRRRVARRSYRKVYRKRTSWISNSYVRINRAHAAASIAGDGITNIQYANFQFSLSQLPNATDFTNLFDQFKINRIKVKVFLDRDYGNGVIPTGEIPRMYYLQDADGQLSGAPASLNELREYSNCKTWQFNTGKPLTIWLRPSILNWIYRTGGVTEATVPMAPRFISTNYADVSHAGLRVAIENLKSVNQLLRFEATYYMTFRNAK